MSLRIFIIFLLVTIVFVPLSVSESRFVPLVNLQGTPTPSPSPKPMETWWQRVLRISGISANPGVQRSPGSSGVSAGDIYVKSLVRQGGVRLATGSYRSPIFIAKDQSILALTGDAIVLMAVSGAVEHSTPNTAGITKLVGISQDDEDKILVVNRVGEENFLGLLSLANNSLTTIPFETKTTQGKNMFAQIVGWDRVYCNTEVYVETLCEKDERDECKRDRNNQVKSWTDVMVKRAYKSALNVSNCRELSCGQPSLSLDGESVVYIKERR